MSSAQSLEEITQPALVPRLLVEQPSRPRIFFSNLRELLAPRRLPPLDLHSAPADFWPDVLVERRLPWPRFIQSIALHAVAFGLLIGLTRFFSMQPRVIAKPAFEQSQVIYYQASEYLPPLDTRHAERSQPAKADPELSPQPIISVPREADNRSQTIVTPPSVKLNRDVPLPNIVAWSDAENQQKPRLDIPPVPLTPAAELTRIAPEIENAVAAPPPDVSNLNRRRNSPALQSSLIAPPPDLAAPNAATFQAPQPAVVAPPPSVSVASARPVGELNIGPGAVIAPSPKLAVTTQRAVRGLPSGSLGAPQLVAPPPSLTGGGPSSGSFGARGRLIALSLHPAVNAPPNPPAGNRRGTFASAPDGHSGASGAPGVANNAPAGNGSGKGAGTGPAGRATSDVPSGLYVGKAAAPTTSVTGHPTSSNVVNPNLLADARPPRLTGSPPGSAQPGSAKLSEPERAVFGDRRVYS